MPQDKAFSELSKGDQLSRANKALRLAKTAESEAGTNKERARHQAAGKAASRVIGRLGGTAPSSADVVKPGEKKKKAAAKLRVPFEKGTGTDKTKKALEGVRALTEAANK